MKRLLAHYIKTLLISAVIIGAGLFNAVAAQSPSGCMDESYWGQLTDVQRREVAGKSFKAKNIGDECFYTMVSSLLSADKKLLGDSLAVIFASRAAKGGFSSELLFLLFKNRQFVSDKKLWGGIIDIWSAAAPIPVYAFLASVSDGGKLPAADTLYRALDAAGRLDAHELLRYGRVRSLLGDYRAAARIYCRVIDEDKRVEPAAMTQMGQLFADADSSEKAAALEDFRKCALASPSVDTAYVRDWIAGFYGKHGLYDREIATLAALDMPSAPSGRKLAEAAKGHFSRRRYRHAASGAVAAHGRIEDRDLRSSTAFVAYQAYMNLGIRDSALVWLRLSEVASKDARIQAAALSQETGHLSEAAAIIDSLPPSLPKDTLLVRQMLFSGEPDRALNSILASKSVAWMMNPRDRMLWRGRCMVFGGRAGEAAPVLDSVKFAATWHGASETLRYRYWIQKLEDDGAALGVWGKLEYLIYAGDLDGAAKALGAYGGMSGEAGEMLAVRLARALLKSVRYPEALSALELVKGGGGPEYLYFKAEALNGTGRREEARALANRILTEFPADIFAQKARVLLLKI